MRQIILDTETTGLETAEGHRVIEIGCVELLNRRLTGVTFHRYLNPDRKIDAEAQAVHGISNEFLADKPRFADIAEAFMRFIEGAELVIHNASFDLGFLNHELRLLGQDWPPLEQHCQILDTLALARRKHPGQKNNLDALCKRYSIDNSGRDLHGALLDSQILAEVYLAMTGGQTSLLVSQDSAVSSASQIRRLDPHRPRLAVVEPDAEEIAAHQSKLERLDKASGGNCLWRSLEADTPAA